MDLKIFKVNILKDLKLIRRDSFLMWMAFVPVILSLILYGMIPQLTAEIKSRFPEILLSEYYPLILSVFFILLIPTMTGLVMGFLFLDERDDGILTSLLTTPQSLRMYFWYRMAAMVLLSVLLTIFSVFLTGLVNISLFKLFAISLTVSLMGPLNALFLLSFAENKVQGMAQMKLLGSLNSLVFFAYFVREPWQFLFGINPIFWPAKAFWHASKGGGDLLFFLYLGIGIITLGISLKILFNFFYRRSFLMD